MSSGPLGLWGCGEEMGYKKHWQVHHTGPYIGPSSRAVPVVLCPVGKPQAWFMAPSTMPTQAPLGALPFSPPRGAEIPPWATSSRLDRPPTNNGRRRVGMSDPFASIYLRVQSFWFWARSKPGLQSQATPPLGVSRQMWAQPWSLFMQFIPSGKRQIREGWRPVRERQREDFRLKRDSQ